MSPQANVAAPVRPAALSVPFVTPDAVPAPEPITAPSKISVQEYFELERTSDIRYEYVEGEIIPMHGESLPHNRIALNFSICFDRAFEGRICEVFMESVRLRVSPSQYRYPDVVALCGEPVTDGGSPPALLNPNVIIEVLSPSTSAIDRGIKLAEYREISGLTDYVMVAQNRVSVTHCARQNARQWTLTEYTELTDTLNFVSLDVTLSLADVYRKIMFSAPDTPAPAEAAD